MTTRRVDLMFVVLAFLACGAPVAGQSDPILFLGWPPAFYLFTPTTGEITILGPGPVGTGPVQRMEILPGNRQVLGFGQVAPGPTGFYIFDRDSRTVFAAPTLPMANFAIEFSVDQDGDYLVTNRDRGVWWYDHLNPSGNQVQLFQSGYSEVIEDIDTGDYVFIDSPSFNLVRGRRSGQITPITTVNLGVGKRVYQDYATGEFLYWPTQFLSLPQVLLRISAAGVVTSTMTIPEVRGDYAMEVFSEPAPEREYLVPVFGYAEVKGLYTIARSNGQTRLFRQFPPNTSVLALVRDRSRKLSTVGTGSRNQWTLFIDFADDANRTYVCMAGMTGIRPGLPLPDGRVIRLNPDPLTYLALNGQIPGFSGLVGQLDSRGTGQGIIDLGWLPSRVAGNPFWLTGLTVDSQAPSGIRTVSDPIVIQLR